MGHRDEAMVLVGLMLGLRPGEILGLPWDAVDLKKRTLEVKQSLKRLPDKSLVIGPPKADSHRNLQLPDRVATALVAHRRQQKKDRIGAPIWEDHGLVFTTEIGTPIDPSNLRRTTKRPVTTQASGTSPPTSFATPPPASWSIVVHNPRRLPTCSGTATFACSRRPTATRFRKLLT